MDEKPKKLRYKEKRFVKEYIKNNGNGKQAVIAAGYNSSYPDKMANKILNRPHIQHTMAQILAERDVDYQGMAAELLLDVINTAKASPDLKAKTDALDKVAKILGLAAPKEVHNKTLKATVKLPGSD